MKTRPTVVVLLDYSGDSCKTWHTPVPTNNMNTTLHFKAKDACVIILLLAAGRYGRSCAWNHGQLKREIVFPCPRSRAWEFSLARYARLSCTASARSSSTPWLNPWLNLVLFTGSSRGRIYTVKRHESGQPRVYGHNATQPKVHRQNPPRYKVARVGPGAACSANPIGSRSTHERFTFPVQYLVLFFNIKGMCDIGGVIKLLLLYVAAVVFSKVRIASCTDVACSIIISCWYIQSYQQQLLLQIVLLFCLNVAASCTIH